MLKIGKFAVYYQVSLEIDTVQKKTHSGSGRCLLYSNFGLDLLGKLNNDRAKVKLEKKRIKGDPERPREVKACVWGQLLS